MPYAKNRNPVVRDAVKRALELRGLTYHDAADLLGVQYQTAKDQISSGVFSQRAAARWAAALGIPCEVFTDGVMIDALEPFVVLSYQDITKEISSLKGELAELKTMIEDLQRWKDIVCGNQ